MPSPRFVVFAISMIASMVVVSCCANMQETARETFSRKRSCPLDGVTAKERPDLSAFDLAFERKVTPPPDVAADPARLRMWQEEQDRKRASWEANEKVFEVSGCNEAVLYTCHVGKTSRGSGQASCSEVKGRKP